jgi:competence protein ComEA
MHRAPKSKSYRNYAMFFALNIAIFAGILYLLRRETPRPVVVTQPGPRTAVPAASKPTPAKPTPNVNTLVGSATATPDVVPAPVSGKLNLNSATLEQLETLPHIGPALAQRILDYRAEKGRFASVRELIEVRGIGEAILTELEPLVTVR